MSDNKKNIANKKETESIPENIPEIMAQLTQTQMSRSEFSGPLPQEVLRNLSKEDKEKLINNYIDQEAKDYQKELLMIKNSTEIARDRDKKIFIVSILSMIFFLILVALCLLTGNKEILIDILKIFVGFLGGTGFGIYIKSKKDE